MSQAARETIGEVQTLGGWELVSLAAEGAWARIYRARPAGGARRGAAYALKVLRPDRRDDPIAAGLLAREAMVGRSVSHPHLAAVLEARVRRPPRYLVMPWLEGRTLQSQLALQPWIDLPFALWIARQAAEGLQGLEAAGWRHGDIKPSNIFLAPEGHVTLLDLGLARRRDETARHISRTISGTGYYLAPEHCTASLMPDIRADIYSLGVVLYEMLACRLPFEARSLSELTVKHKQWSAPNLRRLAPHLPAEVVRLVHQMLAKDPLRRPQTPGEVVEQLVRLEIATFSERAG